MKTKNIFPVIVAVLSIALAAGVLTIFHPCNEEKKMACFYTSRAEVALGVLVFFLSAVSFFFGRKERGGIFIASAGIGILAAVFPVAVTGVCKMSSMHCRKATLPFAVLVGTAIFIVSSAGAFRSLKREKSQE